jgi:hypothetical protein
LIEEIETLTDGGEIFLPETEEEVVDFVEGGVVPAVVDLARGGFLHRLRDG